MGRLTRAVFKRFNIVGILFELVRMHQHLGDKTAEHRDDTGNQDCRKNLVKFHSAHVGIPSNYQMPCKIQDFRPIPDAVP